MNTVYTCENMMNTLDSMIAVIEPEMPRQIQRWGGSMQEWRENIDTLKNFINQRCELLDDGMVDCYDVTGPYSLTLLVDPPGVGEIDINTLDIETFPWVGYYFGNMANKIKARSFTSDYEFSHWITSSGNVIFPNEFERKAEIYLSQADTLTAVFQMPTSIYDLENIVSFDVRPSLTDGDFYMNVLLTEKMTSHISIYTQTGKLMHQIDLKNIEIGNWNHKKLNTKQLNLPSGLHFISLITERGVLTRKMVVL